MIAIICIVLMFLAVPVYAETVNIAELQNLVIKENPRLRSMEFESGMMEKRISPSGSLDDMRLKLAVNNVPANNFSFSSEDMTSKEIGISQMIPLGGKLTLKERIASKEHAKSLERLRKERIDLLNSVRTAAYELLYYRLATGVAEEVKDQLKVVEDSQLAASKAGMTGITGAIKSNIETLMTDEEIINLRQAGADALRKLRYLAGRDVELKDSALPEAGWGGMKLDEAVQTALQNNSDIRLLIMDQEIARDETLLRKKEYIPDMELGLSYMQRNKTPEGMRRDDMVTAMATFNLPVWFYRKNEPMISGMEKKQSMIAQSLKDRENEIRFKLETGFNRLGRWESLYTLYKDKLVPQTSLTLETALAGYRANTVEIMSVIDTVRQLLRYKREMLMAKKEYLSAVSEINAVMGNELVP